MKYEYMSISSTKSLRRHRTRRQTKQDQRYSHYFGELFFAFFLFGELEKKWRTIQNKPRTEVFEDDDNSDDGMHR